MVSCAWETRTRGAVVLVGGRCRSDGRVERAVDLAPAGPGPVWPPRMDPPGVEWAGGRASLRVPVGAVVPVGFATTVPVPDPPVTVVSDDPVTDASTGSVTDASDDAVAGVADGPSPAAVVRSLSTPAPPPEAIPDRLEVRPPAAVRDWLETADRRLATADERPSGTDAALGRQLSVVAERAGRLANRAEGAAKRTGSGPEQTKGPRGDGHPREAHRR